MVNFSSRQNFLVENCIQAVMLQQNRRVTIKIIQKLPTLMESKHAVTRPFWTSTWGGGCANLHSVSVRVHLLRWYSRQTSRVSHRESFTLLPIANRLFTMAITRCHTKMKDCWVSYDQTQKFQSREPIKGAQFSVDSERRQCVLPVRILKSLFAFNKDKNLKQTTNNQYQQYV